MYLSIKVNNTSGERGFQHSGLVDASFPFLLAILQISPSVHTCLSNDSTSLFVQFFFDTYISWINNNCTNSIAAKRNVTYKSRLYARFSRNLFSPHKHIYACREKTK